MFHICPIEIGVALQLIQVFPILVHYTLELSYYKWVRIYERVVNSCKG